MRVPMTAFHPVDIEDRRGFPRTIAFERQQARLGGGREKQPPIPQPGTATPGSRWTQDPGRSSAAERSMGTGSIASYRRPGQEWTFYEVDPTVVELARDSGYFTYLSECSTDIKVVLGDARLSLAKEPGNQFDLLVLDAYNSDSVPIHLITQEALRLYLNKITDHGLIIFHISNQYLDLTPVVANLAQDLGLVCFLRNDLSLSEQERQLGKEPSQWAIMARHLEDLGGPASDPLWQRLEGSGGPVWTDNYSSIFRVLKWNPDSP